MVSKYPRIALLEDNLVSTSPPANVISVDEIYKFSHIDCHHSKKHLAIKTKSCFAFSKLGKQQWRQNNLSIGPKCVCYETFDTREGSMKMTSPTSGMSLCHRISPWEWKHALSFRSMQELTCLQTRHSLQHLELLMRSTTQKP